MPGAQHSGPNHAQDHKAQDERADWKTFALKAAR